MEEWRAIPEFPGYEISNLGRVNSLNYWRTTQSRLMTPSLGKRGYLVVTLHKDKKQYTKTVHSLLAKAFLPNPEGLPCVDHINRDKTDNRLDNLRWVSDWANKQNRSSQLGELYIYKTISNTYRLHINHLHIQKRYKTLEEAILARDTVLSFTTESYTVESSH